MDAVYVLWRLMQPVVCSTDGKGGKMIWNKEERGKTEERENAHE